MDFNLLRIFRIFKFTVSKSILAILLLIIQSCGIGFFEKKGTILMVVVLLFSYQGFKNLTSTHLKNILMILLFLGVSKAINPSFEFSTLIFQCGLVIETYIFLLCYRKKGVDKLVSDFYQALNILFVNALIGYLLFLVIPFAFIAVELGYPYKTLGFLFYVSNAGGFNRNNGLLWEPGLLQLMLNIYLFYSIKYKKPSWYLLLITLTIIPTFSTSGYFCLFVNYLYYIVYNFKANKRRVITLIVITLLSSSSLVFIWANVTDKLGGDNLSGLARYRDLYIGIELIKERPLLGHGVFTENYLKSKPYVSSIETQLFGSGTIDIIGSLSGGYVNGFLDVFAWFGIPAAIFIFYNFYKNKFINGSWIERLLFFLIMCFTFLAEPITYTSFFLMFPLSVFVFSVKYFNKKVINATAQYDIYNHSHL